MTGADSQRDAAVKSSLRTLQILELLSSAEHGLSIADVSRQLSIPKSSLHGIMRTMAARGWLVLDSAGLHYSLGLKAALASLSFLDRDVVVGMSRAALDKINQTSGEAVHLGRLDGAEIVYLAKRESHHSLRLYSAVGRRLPAHATALGKAVLATLDPDELAGTLPASLPGLTINTITTRHHLFDELEATRQRGYAIDNGESEDGIYCLAIALVAPVARGSAVSCSVPIARMSSERLGGLLNILREGVREVDALLSHTCLNQIAG